MDEQQLLLWRLSTAVQLVSLAMIAVFFAIFARLNPRAEVTWWARAWFANLLALSVTLANRRALPEIFRAVQPNGATLLFFDLNGFKQVNDRHGHAAGDECLKVFSSALRESFRPDDSVLRYGGDEFLVIAPGLDSAGARARVEALNGRLARVQPRDIVCGFSVGMSELAPGGNPEAAVEAADQNMYRAKGVHA